MKESIVKYMAGILAWILFYNFIYITFSPPSPGFYSEKIYPVLTEESLFISSVIAGQTQKKENNFRPNNFLSFYFSPSVNLLLFENYLFLPQAAELNYITFNYFLTSHFATST